MLTTGSLKSPKHSCSDGGNAERMFAPGVTAAMVAIEFVEVSISTISKAAMNRGMSQFIFVLYSNALAIFILLPSTFIFYRKRTLPLLTASIICRILLLGLISFCIQVSVNIGIGYSSPTMASAMFDITPAFTFFLAVFSMMERLDLRIQSSRAKSLGTVASIAGALIMTLYKGQAITSAPAQRISHEHFLSLQPNWIVGGILCAVAALCLALLYIVQTWIMKDYPAEMTVTLIVCIVVTVLSVMVSLIAVKDPISWTLKPDIELLAIVLSAVFQVSLRSVVHIWACRKKGPVFTAMFKPLGMVIAMFLGVSFLGDTLYFGSVIGGTIIAFGFYAVIWGKAQEEKMVGDNKGNSHVVESSSDDALPLLHNKDVEK